MAQPNWITGSGNLGLFPSDINFNITFMAEPVAPAVTLTYQLLNGTLPEGTVDDPIVFTSLGILSGTPKNVNAETSYTFTLRITDNLGNIRDRTFSMRVFGSERTRIGTPDGQLFTTVDSKYIDYQIAVINPLNDSYRVVLSSGSLPPGLYMDLTGRITGYPEPPVLLNGSVTTKTYNFSVKLTSDYGTDTKNYSATIRNFELTNPPNTRPPAIINNTPLVQPVPLDDLYYGYYLPESNDIPPVRAGEYFSFKVMGYDFDRNRITYQFGVLPSGLSGNPDTGWITGVPTLAPNSIAKFEFGVYVAKTNNLQIISGLETFHMTIENGITEDIVWSTSSDLGTVNNGTISELYVEATSVRNIEYRLMSGSLPPNLTLLPNGQITGRVPFQPTTSLLNQGDSTTFTFTIKAFNPEYPVVSNEREFTLTVYQKYSVPVENVYFKAAPNVTGRNIIQSLLTDEELIPTNYLYRVDDPYFGKAEDVRFTHIYGMEPANLPTYIDTIGRNHYNRKLILGEIKTAVARDENFNVIYEVVYADIVDDMINSSGTSIPLEIIWPRKISMDAGPYQVTNTEIFTSSETIYDSYTAGFVRNLYPASTTNMRQEVIDRLSHNTSQEFLPKWMTSQQSDGNTLGFVQAWVIAYTLPGKSATIKSNIETLWPHTLNMIDFSIDRLLVDRSGTFNYNTNLYSGAWTELPGATPTPSTMNQYDMPVLFPRKTILPRNIEY